MLRLWRRVRRLFGSELDRLIPPEIKDDRLYAAIVRVALSRVKILRTLVS